jgi:glyoxylase-like metal-dependent hydrolase (beta-lactamase superfamily II)
VQYIMETHAHADHVTASRYLQQKLIQLGQPRPKIAIGKRITPVQNTFAEKYGVEKEELEDVFDKLWEDGEEFEIGNSEGEVMYLPGHTPDHVGYKIEGNVLTGDSIFNPDVGSARADFTSGSATDLWTPTQKLLMLPEDFRLYTGHDYPPATREVNEAGEKWKAYTTVADQKRDNKHVKAGTKEEDFVGWRKERDAGLGEPRLFNQAMQVDIRGGRLPRDGFFKVPVKAEEGILEMMRE